MSTAPKSRKPPRTSPATTREPSAQPALPDVPGELRQLAAIRQQFPALAAETAAALHAHHDADACRARGTTTRAAETFRGAMGWARTFGAHAADPAVHPARVRWFLDCLTELGVLLTGAPAAGNPSATSAMEDATQAADKLLARTARRARDAAGTSKVALEALDAALASEGPLDGRVLRLRQLAALLRTWLAQPAKSAPPAAVFSLDAATIKALEQRADTLDGLVAQRAAAQQIDRDSPAVNLAEGRLQFAMRPLWDDLAEGRADGVTALMLALSPTLLRVLNIKTARKTATA